MDFQKLMKQAREVQEQLQKAMKEYDEKLFHFEYQGLVSIDIYGSLKVKTINFMDKSIIDQSDVDNMSDIITQCINNAVDAIIKGKTAITTKIAGPAAEGLM